MLRVTLRGAGVPTVVLGSGETLLVGRDPHAALPEFDADTALRSTAITLPRAAPHVSRVVGEIVVGEEVVRLRWRGSTEAQLSSLFDAPGGARRVALTDGMAALLDEGENHVLLLRGRQSAPGEFTDMVLVVDVAIPALAPPAAPGWLPEHDPDGAVTAPAPRLERWSREWYVALALAEPWLAGDDDYPRPASNRGAVRAHPHLARARLEPRTCPARRRRDPRGRPDGVRPRRRPVRAEGPTGPERAVRRRPPRRRGAPRHRRRPGRRGGRARPAATGSTRNVPPPTRCPEHVLTS